MPYTETSHKDSGALPDMRRAFFGWSDINVEIGWMSSDMAKENIWDI